MAKRGLGKKAPTTTGTVIPFRRRPPISWGQSELIELFNEMAARAARGEITGLMYVSTNDDVDADDEWGIIGAFTKDHDHAVDASAEAYAAAKAYRLEVLHGKA